MEVCFYFLSNNLVVSYQDFLIVFFPLVLQWLMRPYKQVGLCIFIAYIAYPNIGSSSRICWRVTKCARVDTGKENHDKDKGKHNITIRLSFVTFIIYLYRDILLI